MALFAGLGLGLQAAGLLSNILGGGKGQDQGGIDSNGVAYGGGGSLGGSPIVPSNPPIREAQPDIEPLEEPRRQPIKSINNFLGSNIGKQGAEIAGGFISDFRQRRNTKKNYDRLRRQGLTPYEIGGGGAGGVVNSQGNTLGSGPATQVRSQQEFTAGQAAKDRAAAKERAEITAAAPRTQAKVAVERSEREAKLQPWQIEKVQAETTKLREEAATVRFGRDNFWAIKFSTMSRENIMAALAMFNSGLDFRDVLGRRAQTPEEAQQANELMELMLLIAGSSGGAIGWWEFFKSFLKGEAGFFPGEKPEGPAPPAKISNYLKEKQSDEQVRRYRMIN